MEIEIVDIDSVIPDPKNARKHNQKNLDSIKGSLKNFRQQKPIVVSKETNIVLAGNGTLEAAKILGWKKIAICRSDLTGMDAVAYSAADNRAGELAEWNDDALSKTLEALKLDGFDLSSIGFDGDDLAQWLKTPEVVPGCDEDEVPEVTETRCKSGDLWQLGNHRLLCGDSTNVQHVERLMGAERADMVFTDPPYGVNENTARAANRQGTFKAKPIGGGKNQGYKDYSPIVGDDTTDTAIASWHLATTFSEIVVYWGGNYYPLPPSPCWVVWDKRVEENQHDVNSDCELAYVKHPHKKSVRIFRHLWKGMLKDSEYGQARVHPTQKPIALADWCFGELDPKGKSVLDLFLGSGSTLIACEKTNRRCFGLEIDPHYCSVVLARWEKFTGKTAILLAGEKQDA